MVLTGTTQTAGDGTKGKQTADRAVVEDKLRSGGSWCFPSEQGYWHSVRLLSCTPAPLRLPLCLAGETSPLHSSPRRPNQVGVLISTALMFRSASETAATANYKNRASRGCRVLRELFLLAQGHLNGVVPSYNPKSHLVMPEERRLGWLQRAQPAPGLTSLSSPGGALQLGQRRVGARSIPHTC